MPSFFLLLLITQYIQFFLIKFCGFKFLNDQERNQDSNLGGGGGTFLFEDFRNWDINAREGKVTISLLVFQIFFLFLQKTILSHNLQIKLKS